MTRSAFRLVGVARRARLVFLSKALATAAVLAVPIAVGVPGSDVEVPLDTLLPLLFALPTAVTLWDRLSWLSPRFSVRYSGAVLFYTSAPTVLVGSAAVTWAWSTGTSDRLVAAALVAEAATLLIAVRHHNWAWVAATVCGVAAAINLPALGVLLFELVPLLASIIVWTISLLVYCAATTSRFGRASDSKGS